MRRFRPDPTLPAAPWADPTLRRDRISLSRDPAAPHSDGRDPVRLMWLGVHRTLL